MVDSVFIGHQMLHIAPERPMSDARIYLHHFPEDNVKMNIFLGLQKKDISVSDADMHV